MEVHHLHQQQQQYHLNVNPDPGGGDGGGGSGGVSGGGERDRFPQWSQAETKEFLAIRAELDRSFVETKRNRHLWAAVSDRMAAKGFHRTPDQCKCKWKNLVTRYKGCEAMEGDSSKQFPFHEDMRRIFSERMERLLSFDDGKQGAQAISEDEYTNEPCGAEPESSRKKRKVGGGGASSSGAAAERDLESILREFMRWHVEMEMQRLQAAEAREMERMEKEMEWRQIMEALAMERAEMDRRWREREEERHAREEARAERRDALVTALLNKLAQKGL